MGYQIELWGKDFGEPASQDEFIGSWRIGASGVQCATFEWENASYSLGELHPDVYVVFKNEARHPDGGVAVRIVDQNSNNYPDIDWRNGPSGNPEQWVAVNCTGTCSIPDTMAPTSDTSTNYGQAVLAMDSVQLTLQTYSTVMKNDITIEFPSTKPCPTGCAWLRNLIALPAGLATDGVRASHEAGHALQLQNFEQDQFSGDPGCSWNGNGWTMTSIEWQSCATYEGWASYLGGVSWWDPGNSSSQPVFVGFKYGNTRRHE